MINFLYQVTDLEVFSLMIIITIAFSMLLIVINKLFVFRKLKYKDNTATASIASLIGIIYGVLVGFLCLYLLDHQDRASNATMNEGTAAANVYRESKWLKDPTKHLIQSELKTYLTNVITLEWPAMSAGKKTDRGNTRIIDTMSDQIIQYPIVSQADAIKVNDLIQELKALYKGRHERIEISSEQLSPDIWGVILLSTILIIVINYAFRVNLLLHIFSTTAFAIMASSVLFLLVTLDRPFQGEFVVQPDALEHVLENMKNNGI